MSKTQLQETGWGCDEDCMLVICGALDVLPGRHDH